MPEVTRRSLIQAGAAAAVGTSLTAAPAAAAPRRGTLRVLNWNIYRGGKGERVGGAGNFPRLLDQLAAIAPDVFLCVETYGSGPAIERALTRRARNGRYRGVQITDRPSGEDNLWIFTHLPIVRVLPKPSGGELVSDFNLGGVRVELPKRRQVDVFVMWINYTNPWDGYLVDENAAGRRAGLTPRHSGDDVVHAGRRQTAYLREIVDRHLPRMRGGHDGPLIIGGDCNTLPAQDWTAEWADCPNKLGASYALTGTQVFADAGFVDTFRQAHPDVCAVEGRTWTPLPDERLITPQRIDLTFTRGSALSVVDARTVDTRLPQHEPGAFYSDHAAVVTDLDVH